MRRREFISALGSAAAAWPMMARAQQPARPVVGTLLFGSREAYGPIIAGLKQGLREAGYLEGQNVTVEYRFADGRRERVPDLAADLVRRTVNVLVAGASTAQFAKSATATIPIRLHEWARSGACRPCYKPQPTQRKSYWGDAHTA
jgi:putative ABC transport system substrate-binding protein